MGWKKLVAYVIASVVWSLLHSIYFGMTLMNIFTMSFEFFLMLCLIEVVVNNLGGEDE
jgi:inner membrane protein involved in colicin E2 resistance